MHVTHRRHAKAERSLLRDHKRYAELWNKVMLHMSKYLSRTHRWLLVACSLAAPVCATLSASAASAQSYSTASATLIADAGGGATYMSQPSASFQDHHQNYWNGNPHEGTEEKALTPQEEQGQTPPDQFGPNPSYAEMTNGSNASQTAQPGPTTSKQAQGSQNDPHPQTVQKEFTIYPNPMLNNYGPPTSLPFHHWLPWEGAPKEVSGGLNPAFTQDLSPWVQKGAPHSDLVSNMSSLTAAKRQADEMLTTNFHSALGQAQSQVQAAGEATHASAQAQLAANLQTVQTYLINVANEDAGAPASTAAPTRTLPQAIWMVQQMYKNVFIPMAVLLILPGAILTQIFAIASGSGLSSSQDERNPFTGILRATVAVFLIPATQVIVSYGIDIGNSTTYEVTNFLNAEAIMNWTQPMLNPYQGMTAMQKENAQKDQSTGAALMETALGTVQMLLGNALMVLAAYQVVLACYLFLFGPVAAAFLAWPARVGNLFKPVFSQWLGGLINLVLWRFWWCIIVLVMTTRLQWLQELGQPTNGPWEKLVFTAFTVMLAYVPFAPFDFRPGDLVEQILQQTNGGNGS